MGKQEGEDRVSIRRDQRENEKKRYRLQRKEKTKGQVSKQTPRDSGPCGQVPLTERGPQHERDREIRAPGDATSYSFSILYAVMDQVSASRSWSKVKTGPTCFTTIYLPSTSTYHREAYFAWITALDHPK